MADSVVDVKSKSDDPQCNGADGDVEDDCGSPDPYFTPLISLPEVPLITCEEDEDVLWQQRAKLYRYDTSTEPPSWKERGIGEVKFMKHAEKGCVRLIMRRDQTYKVCANHYISPAMKLTEHSNSDRCWIWQSYGDYSDDMLTDDLLCIRFKTVESAQEFRQQFNEAKQLMQEYHDRKLLDAVKCPPPIVNTPEKSDHTSDVTSRLAKLDVTVDDEKKA